jgi:sterol desaturase/sphingolipid hydroxylase (fatty acid hydroxylase superfamily)
VIESSGSENLGGKGGYRRGPIEMAPLYRWPPQPAALLKWLFGFPSYFWPWQALFIFTAWLSWRFLAPDTATMKSLSAGWIALILLHNLLLLITFVSLWHVWLYARKSQDIQYKYNSRWLSVGESPFLFRNQLWDNVFWSLCSAVPIWTGYEILTLWLQAHGFASSTRWGTHPVYCTFLVFLTPVWLNTYFYFFHRFLHWEPLYQSVHYLHHKNINVGPWSGLAMHPLEHLVYFSAIVLLWVIPSHPFYVFYLSQTLALGPTLEHQGFDRVILRKKLAFNTEHFMHYLHHKYVKVNFGTDTGFMPLDKWLGTFHDGSEAAQEIWKKRMREQSLRLRQR